MNVVIPEEICNMLLPNEEILFSYTCSSLGYYFTDTRIFIEKNEAIEKASKDGSLLNLAIGFFVKPKKYSCIYYNQIQDPELLNFGLNIHLTSGRVEEIKLRYHEDACNVHRFIHAKINEKKENVNMPRIINVKGTVG